MKDPQMELHSSTASGHLLQARPSSEMFATDDNKHSGHHASANRSGGAANATTVLVLAA